MVYADLKVETSVYTALLYDPLLQLYDSDDMLKWDFFLNKANKKLNEMSKNVHFYDF